MSDYSEFVKCASEKASYLDINTATIKGGKI